MIYKQEITLVEIRFKAVHEFLNIAVVYEGELAICKERFQRVVGG